MVYRRVHCEENEKCLDDSCTSLIAYVRINGDWTVIGRYGSLCKQFDPLDPKKEEEDRLLKQRIKSLQEDVRNIQKGNFTP